MTTVQRINLSSVLQSTPSKLGVISSPFNVDSIHGSDLRKAWNNTEIRKRIEVAIANGNFKDCVDLGNTFIQKIDTLCKSSIPNDQLYEGLRKFFEGISSGVKENFQAERLERVQRRVAQVNEVLNGFHPKSYVDIGCGSGDITEQLQSLWKLPKEKATGLEVYIREETNPPFQLVKFNGESFPLYNESHDLGTIFAVLHHTKDPSILLKEAYRVLKPSGHLIVRELDSGTDEFKLFNLVMDHIFYKVYIPSPDVPIPGNYLGVEEWKQIFLQAGFSINKIIFPEPTNPYCPFIVDLRK